MTLLEKIAKKIRKNINGYSHVETVPEIKKESGLSNYLNEKDYQSLLKRLIHFLPTNKKENALDIYIIFDILDGLIHGDMISRYTASKQVNEKYVQEAFAKITPVIQEATIANYHEEVEKSKQELAVIQEENNSLITLNNEQKMKNEELKKENEELKREKTELLVKNQNDLAQIKNTQNELQRLQAEIEILKSLKSSLMTEVDWLPITEEDPIYGVSAESINLYLEAGIKEYMKKLNVSEEEAKQAFIVNSPGLITLKMSFTKLSRLTSAYNNSPITTILKELKILEESGRDSRSYPYYYTNLKDISTCLEKIKVPHYRNINNVLVDLEQTENQQLHH